MLESLYGFEEEELTIEEVADNLGMKRMAVYQKLHRLYVKLRRELRSRDTVN
jgi:DNA-directed RNA polymerase specialized sigma subunit